MSVNACYFSLRGLYWRHAVERRLIMVSSQHCPLAEGRRLADKLAAMIRQVPNDGIPDHESLPGFRYADTGVVVDVALGGNPVEEPLSFMPVDRSGGMSGGKMDYFFPRHFEQSLRGAVGIEEHRVRGGVMGKDDERSVIQEHPWGVSLQFGQERMAEQPSMGIEDERGA